MRHLLVFGALALAACSSDPRKAGGPLAADLTTADDHEVTGSILSADGTNICSSLSNPFGDLLLVRPIAPGGAVRPNLFLFCPTNTFSVSLPAGNYFLRATLPSDPVLGASPVRTIVPLVVQDADVVQNIVIQPGIALGGSATLDGAAIADVDMSLTYGFDSRYAAGLGASGPDGSWTEFFRPPLILQPGVQYATPGTCTGLGARVLESPPPTFSFPTVSAVNCKLESTASQGFSHTHTRVVVTPFPGDIGGQASTQVNKYGVGWGVQFPVEPGQRPAVLPATASHLFGGGLMIGLSPDRILTGTDVTGQLDCTTCQDLGVDGALHFTPETASGRTVSWRYSDATSPEGVGLRVLQRSYDGQRPNDYVLFKFSIQNTSANTLTFYAGDFMDWDVDFDAGDDVGSTEMDGRLMAVTSKFEGTGIHVGSLLLGAPITGTSFWDFLRVPAPFATTAQFQSLSGGPQQTSIGPGDVHYIQGAGPITLKHGKKATIWIGIIAGESHDAFIANALAAQADVASRQGIDDDAASDGPLTVTTKSSVSQPRIRKPTTAQ